MRFELVGKPTVDKPDFPSLAAANDRKPGYEGAMQGLLTPAATPGPFRLTGRCRGDWGGGHLILLVANEVCDPSDSYP